MIYGWTTAPDFRPRFDRNKVAGLLADPSWSKTFTDPRLCAAIDGTESYGLARTKAKTTGLD
ncbi:hypothetical protein [Streptomyces sp. NPDC048002]|uniref:hypothetical protein n=1 Tax=Streptomyces sp. NPDC048002 TaxID=3154344 RepID=UPI0033DE60A2